VDRDQNVYIDDNFSVALADDIDYYEPYKDFFPAAQVKTLCLWDEIGLNHEEPKQVWGHALTVIGFEVDPNAMTFTMPESKRVELLAGVQEFCSVPCRGARRLPLRSFRRLAGWINWSLNVYPLLKPALSHVYEKMEGKTNANAGISLSTGVINDLAWFSRHVTNSTGVHLLEAVDWEPEDADIIAFCDASLKGLGFYFPFAVSNLHRFLRKMRESQLQLLRCLYCEPATDWFTSLVHGFAIGYQNHTTIGGNPPERLIRALLILSPMGCDST
jgi:hypothetical protein